jgi:transcription elongation factor GreB
MFESCRGRQLSRVTMSRRRTRPDESKVPSYITSEGYRRLEEEAHRLWTVERPKLTKGLAIAAAEGDRSENAEYIYTKRKLFEVDRRLQFLGKRLEVLKVVSDKPVADGRVRFGTYVTISDDDGAERTLRIVGPDETDTASMLVSCESPMGKALLGHREGDEVVVPRPKGDATFVIEAVSVDPPKVR